MVWRWILEVKCLDFPWGLQVSLCTGIARRIPLKELFNDTLLDFALQPLGEEQNDLRAILQNLFDQASVEDYTKYIKTLRFDEPETIWKCLDPTFHTLSKTGVD